MLRGAFLRNTKWILGAIIYTGEDTKIMRNAEPGRIKQSNIETMMNSLIFGVLSFQLILCIISAIFAANWLSDTGKDHQYIW